MEKGQNSARNVTLYSIVQLIRGDICVNTLMVMEDVLANNPSIKRGIILCLGHTLKCKVVKGKCSLNHENEDRQLKYVFKITRYLQTQ